MLKMLVLLTAALGSFTTAAHAADAVRGSWNGEGFTAYVSEDRELAEIVWDDGAPGVTLPRDHSQTFRCDCVAYKAAPRQLIVEWQLGTDNILSARYQRLDQSTNPTWAEAVRGNWQGYGFVVRVSADKEQAKLEWDDGTPGVILPRDHSQTFRCDCIAYKAFPRQVLVQWQLGTGIISSATYQRLDR